MSSFFDYSLVDNIDSIAIDRGRTSPQVVNCLNPHSFVIALDDPLFRQALNDSDMLLPDGEGVCLAIKRYRHEVVRKIAGDDLHRHLLRQLEECSGKAYYMGSNSQVLSLIENRLAKEYPSIGVRTCSPSYCDELTDEESMRIIDDINAFAPDVLFVSMTAPKQEKWVEKYRSQITSPSIVASIGAVFEFYAGTVKRAPQWAIKMKLEWLFRLIKEPRRMWQRNFVSTPRFLKWVRQHHEEM